MYSNKILFFIFTCTFLFACSSESSNQNQTEKNKQKSNSETIKVDEANNRNGKCPDQPGKLDPSNVEKVTLDGNQTTVSGQLTADEALGYTFSGKKDQKLSYSTQDEFCMWVLTPNNDPLEGLKLPEDGSYIVQISIPKGAKTFELAMQLKNPDSSYDFQDRSQSNSFSFRDNQNSNNINSSPKNTPSITAEKAVNIIQKWQEAKRQIFAPPYNRYKGEKLLTGKAYGDNIRKPDGSGSSVDWLENNEAYYTYQLQKIDEITNFQDFGGSALIDIVTREKRTLCIDGQPSHDDNTAYDKRLVRYNLQYIEGQWKISSYDTQKVINQAPNSNKSCQIER